MKNLTVSTFIKSVVAVVAAVGICSTDVSARNWYLCYNSPDYPYGHIDDMARFQPIGGGRYVLIRDARYLLNTDNGWTYTITDGIDYYGDVESSSGHPLRPNNSDNSENPKSLTIGGSDFKLSSFNWGHNGGENYYALIWDENTKQLSALHGAVAAGVVTLKDGLWDYEVIDASEPFETLPLELDGDRLVASISFENDNPTDNGFMLLTQREWPSRDEWDQSWWPGWNYRNLFWANTKADQQIGDYLLTQEGYAVSNGAGANCFKVGQAGTYRLEVLNVFDNEYPEGTVRVIDTERADTYWSPLTVVTPDGEQTIEPQQGKYVFRTRFSHDDKITIGTGSDYESDVDKAWTYKIHNAGAVILTNNMSGADIADEYIVTVDLSFDNQLAVKFEPVIEHYNEVMYLLVKEGDTWRVADTLDGTKGDELFESVITIPSGTAAAIAIADNPDITRASRVYSVAEAVKAKPGEAYTMTLGADEDNLGYQITPAKIYVVTDMSDVSAPRLKIKAAEGMLGDKIYISYTRYEDTGEGWIMEDRNGVPHYYGRIKDEVWYCGVEMEPVEGREGVFTYVLPLRNSGEQHTCVYISTSGADDTDIIAATSLVYNPAESDGNIYYLIDKTIPISTSWGTQKPFIHYGLQGSYRFTVDMSDRDNVTLTITPEERWYFYGDMNMWSIIGENAGDPQTIINKDGTEDKTAQTFKNGERYLTPDELNSDWLFQPCEAPAIAPDDAKDNWVCLDFSTKTDNDGHANRLCGQFKIIDGFWGGLDFGPNVTTGGTNEYYEASVKGGELYEANYFSSNLNYNFYLENAYYENARLYFRRNPERDYTQQVENSHGELVETMVYSAYVYLDVTEEDTHDIYTYYIGHTGTEEDPAPEVTDFNDLSQYIYFVDSNEYENGEWEYVKPAIINGKVYPNGAYRKKIPAAAAHRFPIEFNVSVSKTDGTMFPSQRIECEDILFSDRGVNLYVRYANGYEPESIAYNVNQPQYDEEGFELEPLYIAGTKEAFVDLNRGVVAEDPVNGGYHRWFSTAVPIDFAQQRCYAVLLTSDGERYPELGFDAPRRELRLTEFDGNDMYYIIPGDGGVELLYSHLNGTYHLGNRHGLQIQAEYVGEDALMHTGYDDAQYTFTVTAPDMTEESVTSTAPFMDFKPTEAGVYTVVVEAELNGRRLTAADRYPVYPDQFGSDEMGQPAEAYYLSDFVTSTAHPTNPQYNNVKQLDIKHYMGQTETDDLEGHDVKYSWVKFEDVSQYNDEEHQLSDNPLRDDDDPDSRPNAIDNNNTKHHECCNFSNAYYRFYAVRSNSVMPYAVHSLAVVRPEGEQRVARTIAVNDNTSGIEEIAVDADVNDIKPHYYNLQGIEVTNPGAGQVIIERRGTETVKRVWK